MLPLVSCLLVTTDRLRLLKEAIACYCAQTYSQRELVIIAAGSERYKAAIVDHLRSLGRDDIRLERVNEPSPSLGRLRNRSLDCARGELVCQWDDDDLHHPRRVEAQVAALLTAAAFGCFLTEHLQLFTQERVLYWIDWAQNSSPPREDQMIPGTLLCRRDQALRYPERGALSQSGEDNHLRAEVYARGAVTVAGRHGHLYVYRFHGRNVTSRAHHDRIASWGALDAAAIRAAQPSLSRALADYPLPLPCTMRARGGDAVFTFKGAL
jgi:glycosyltransferase involved in cell wall biosynthesis